KQFSRPVVEPARIKGPASRVRKELPLVEIELASPQILSQLFLVSDVGERTDETSDDSVLVDWTANHSDYPYFTIGSDDAMFVLMGLTIREDLFCFPQEPLAIIRVYVGAYSDLFRGCPFAASIPKIWNDSGD